MPSLTFRTTLRGSALAAAALLAACGGGGSDDTSVDTGTSQETAQSVSANSMVVPEETATAMATTLSITQVVVAGGQIGQTYTCAGGGSAVFLATGGSVSGLQNGQLDAGEVYSLQFNGCRGSAGAARVDGAMTLTVTAASSSGVSVDTRTQAVTVTLPQRTLTLNGSSTLSQTTLTSGSSVVTTTRWTSPQITLASVRNGVTSSVSLTDVDLSRSVTTTSGVVSGSTNSGGLTLGATWLTNAWSARIATQGAVSYDASGNPTLGRWTLTLPNNELGLQIGAGTATITIDHGPDGSIDHTYTYTTTALANQAV